MLMRAVVQIMIKRERMMEHMNVKIFIFFLFQA